VAADPVRTGGIGMLVALGVMAGLVLLFVTIIGIPLSLAGLVLFLLVLWAASVYGRYALGTWLLSYADLDSRWLALVVGVVTVALLGMVPLLGQLRPDGRARARVRRARPRSLERLPEPDRGRAGERHRRRPGLRCDENGSADDTLKAVPVDRPL